MKNLFELYASKQVNPSRKIQQRIEIVGSSNSRLNAMAKDSQLSILAVLRERYQHVSVTIVDTMSDLEALVARKPDLVILGMKLVLLDPTKSYADSPKVWLSSYLEQYGIDFTGSDTTALTSAFDKQAAKQIVIDAGLLSSAYFTVVIGQAVPKHCLRFPLFVKPTNRCGSKGIDALSVVNTEPELRSKVASIHAKLSSDALVEEYLPGREFSVAVIKRINSRELVAMPIEITSPADGNGNSFLSESVKHADSEVVSLVSSQKLKAALSDLAVGVFGALGARDYGRIDMRLDADGNPSFIEANLMPGLSNHGYLVRCFTAHEGVSYEEMIIWIVELAVMRNSRREPTNLLQGGSQAGEVVQEHQAQRAFLPLK